jgi:AcrR family transcriptional regulator
MSSFNASHSRLRATPKPKPRITKADRTRAAILDAALDFVWSHPFRDLTVNKLTETTGITRSVFYRYFDDIHDLMKTLLDMLAGEIFSGVGPWLEGTGDPVSLMNETITGLVQTCYERGPFFRAVSDAARTDMRFEKDWAQFMAAFDEAGCARIKADQAQGLIRDFDPAPVVFALNRLDAYTIIEAFGQRPRSRPGPVRAALARIWISTLYGAEYVEKGASNLIRK